MTAQEYNHVFLPQINRAEEFVDFLSTVLTEEFAKRLHFLFIHHQILLFFQAGFSRTAWIPTNSSYLPRSIGRNCCSRMKKYRRTAITRYSTRST